MAVGHVAGTGVKPVGARGCRRLSDQLRCSLVAAAFAVGEAGFGFYEATFDGGFEDGGFVAFEVGLDALEVGDGFVEAGELLVDTFEILVVVEAVSRIRPWVFPQASW